jgi:hypothetical protein
VQSPAAPAVLKAHPANGKPHVKSHDRECFQGYQHGSVLEQDPLASLGVQPTLVGAKFAKLRFGKFAPFQTLRLKVGACGNRLVQNQPTPLKLVLKALLRAA